MTEDYCLEFAEDLVGVPDPFRRFWTPYRMAYISGENKPRGDRPEDGCPFCSAPQRSDEDALIVHRGEHCYVIMNLYPYGPGHMLVCPYRHVAGYIDATQDEVVEMAQLTQDAIRTLQEVSRPQVQRRHQSGGIRWRRGCRAPASTRHPAVDRGYQLSAHRCRGSCCTAIA
ncbi:HIT family protein [Cutibacterium acnes JCM 18909]|nr:HIT family protein [Cutibacterium acnes JCM 18909]